MTSIKTRPEEIKRQVIALQNDRRIHQLYRDLSEFESRLPVKYMITKEGLVRFLDAKNQEKREKMLQYINELQKLYYPLLFHEETTPSI